MKRALLVLLVAVVLLAGAVAVLAPAALMAPWLERATGGRLAVGEVEGTLWRGQGVLVAAGARTPLAWTLAAAPLLAGEAQVRITPVDVGSPSPRALVTAARKQLALADVALAVPAAVVTRALLRDAPARAGWRVDGEIAATTPRLEWSPAAFGGELRLVWRQARLAPASATAIDLGEATAALTAREGRLAGPLTNAGGDLDLRGEVSLGPDGGAAISLLLTPRRADDAELARRLAAIGAPEGGGWRVSWQTRPR